MATRGDYSDRTEYPVAYALTGSLAGAHAIAMEQRSGVERAAWCAKGDYDYSEWDEMRIRVGDPEWAPNGDTRYFVVEIPELLP